MFDPNSAASIITPMMLLPFTSRSSRTIVISHLELRRELHDLGGGARVEPVLVHDFNRAFHHHEATEWRARRTTISERDAPAIEATVELDERDAEQRSRPRAAETRARACRAPTCAQRSRSACRSARECAPRRAAARARTAPSPRARDTRGPAAAPDSRASRRRACRASTRCEAPRRAAPKCPAL